MLITYTFETYIVMYYIHIKRRNISQQALGEKYLKFNFKVYCQTKMLVDFCYTCRNE